MIVVVAAAIRILLYILAVAHYDQVYNQRGKKTAWNNRISHTEFSLCTYRQVYSVNRIGSPFHPLPIGPFRDVMRQYRKYIMRNEVETRERSQARRK